MLAMKFSLLSVTCLLNNSVKVFKIVKLS